jgi:hypothetical protein
MGTVGGAALVALIAAAPLAGATRPPASRDEIMAGVRSCAAGLTATGLDEVKLAGDGWSKGSITNKGKPVALDLILYGKGNLMLMSAKVPAGKTPICTITARIATVTEYPAIQAAFAAAYGAPVKDDGKGEQLFISPDHRIIDLASTGSNNEPAVRVAVGPVIQETK